MTVSDKPHYTLSAATLAAWLGQQHDKWWSVDGDPQLMSMVDFPCPSDELAPVVRNLGGRLLVRDKTPASAAHGEEIAADRLEECAYPSLRKNRKIYRLSWADSDVEWLLLEAEEMVG